MNQAALQLDDDYPVGFWHWLRQNGKVYRVFEQMAMDMARSGRQRYSARTLVEVLRWNSDVRDSGVTFKINGTHVPGMARLFMEKHGEKYPKFFELREPHH